MLPAVALSKINSNLHDMLLDGQPAHGPADMYGSMDAEWVTGSVTSRSVGCGNLMLVGGAVGYIGELLPMVATTYTKVEFMEAAVMG